VIRAVPPSGSGECDLKTMIYQYNRKERNGLPGRVGGEQLDHPFRSLRPHDQNGEKAPVALLCSCNARLRRPSLTRGSGRSIRPPSCEESTSELGGTIYLANARSEGQYGCPLRAKWGKSIGRASFDARIRGSSRPAMGKDRQANLEGSFNRAGLDVTVPENLELIFVRRKSRMAVTERMPRRSPHGASD